MWIKRNRPKLLLKLNFVLNKKKKLRSRKRDRLIRPPTTTKTQKRKNAKTFLLWNSWLVGSMSPPQTKALKFCCQISSVCSMYDVFFVWGESLFFVETEKIGLKVLIIIKKAMPRGVQALKINETVNDNDETLKIAFLLTFISRFSSTPPLPATLEICAILFDRDWFSFFLLN